MGRLCDGRRGRTIRSVGPCRTIRSVDVAMRRTRASAFPPVKHAHLLAERHNYINLDSLTALILASPIGVADGLLESVVPGTE